ncbi:MAG: Ku domain protein [Bryobacterales bacterium]|nr:Ku domain protein [Bryobacterales bacterium]
MNCSIILIASKMSLNKRWAGGLKDKGRLALHSFERLGTQHDSARQVRLHTKDIRQTVFPLDQGHFFDAVNSIIAKRLILASKRRWRFTCSGEDMASTIWKGHLTFGLVSIPIKLFRAARAEKIHMHRLERRTGARVRQVFVPVNVGAETEQIPREKERASGPSLVAAKRQAARGGTLPQISEEIGSMDRGTHSLNQGLPSSEVVRGFEFEKDKYVAFEPEELEKISPQTSHDMQIVEFVRFDDVDPIYLESSYYVAADKGGEKPYALLFEALKKTGYAAIAELVMHRRDQTMILRPGQEGIIAHTLFYEDEVKRENAFRADSNLVSAKEMELAVKLADALAAKFEPAKLKDKFRERLRGAISAKVETGAVNVTASPQNPPVIDIMTALKESLSTARKPAARQGRAPAANVQEKKRPS